MSELQTYRMQDFSFPKIIDERKEAEELIRGYYELKRIHKDVEKIENIRIVVTEITLNEFFPEEEKTDFPFENKQEVIERIDKDIIGKLKGIKEELMDKMEKSKSRTEKAIYNLLLDRVLLALPVAEKMKKKAEKELNDKNFRESYDKFLKSLEKGRETKELDYLTDIPFVDYILFNEEVLNEAVKEVRELLEREYKKINKKISQIEEWVKKNDDLFVVYRKDFAASGEVEEEVEIKSGVLENILHYLDNPEDYEEVEYNPERNSLEFSERYIFVEEFRPLNAFSKEEMLKLSGLDKALSKDLQEKLTRKDVYDFIYFLKTGKDKDNVLERLKEKSLGESNEIREEQGKSLRR